MTGFSTGLRVGGMALDIVEDSEALLTVRDWVRWGASRFEQAGLCYGHGTDNALDEAYALVMHALHLPRGVPDVYLDARLTPAERGAVAELLRRRVESRLPAPYLTAEAWFAGLSFYVDERVLVPRSPLAELIESGCEPWLQPERVSRVLDIGTGSGCIAIACAYAFGQAVVDAVDRSVDALEVARTNIARHDLGARVRAMEADVYPGLESPARYDLIISNPPYVSETEMAAMPDEYRHEPAVALAGGRDGLGVVRRILAGAPRHLAADGILVVEVGNSAEALMAAYPQVPFLWLSFERGGDGVFLLSAEEVRAHAATFEAGVGDGR